MSNPVNETSQKEHQRNAGKNQEESADHGLSMAPPPFQLATNPSAPPAEKPGGDGDAGDGMPVQRKAFNGTPPANPEENGGNESGSGSGPFQLKASADASTSQPNNSPSSQPFQLKKGDDSNAESRDSFTIQRKAGNGGGGGGEVSGSDNVKSKMSSAFGQDFSSVNFKENSTEATKVGALAYTQGNDVHFAPGQFNPGTKSGQELIGHELAHVVQQREGKVKPTTEIAGKAVNDDKGLEAEADQLGAKAAQFKMDGGAQNLKSGNNPSKGVAQAKMAETGPEKQKNIGDSFDKGQKEAQESESQDADAKAEKTDQVKTPEEKVAKQDQEGQSMRQKDREKAKDTGTVDPTKPKTAEEKTAESGVADRNVPELEQNEGLQEEEAAEHETTQEEQAPQNEQEESENQEAQPATEEAQSENAEAPVAEGEQEEEGKEEGEQENAEPQAENAAANPEGGAEANAEGGGEETSQGAETATAGGGGGGAEKAEGAGGGGGGGKMGLAIGGSGDKPEGDFSKAQRKPLFRVPQVKAGSIPKEAIVAHNADGSVIAQKVNPALMAKKESEQPEQLKSAPIQMKPDPNAPETITPVPQNETEQFYGDRENDNDQLLQQFKTNTGAQLTTFEGLAGNIESELGAAKKKTEGEIRKQTTLSKGRITREFNTSKKRAQGEATKAKQLLNGWNTSLVANIKKATTGAKNKLQREYDTAMGYLNGLNQNISSLISTEISTGAGEIRAVGTSKGQEAIKIAGDRAGAYAAMPIPTMSGTEEFFNGESYERDRHDARVNAAKDVGTAYNQQFIDKANEAAAALEGNLPTILQGAQAKVTEAIEKVKAKKTAGDKEIEASEKSSLDGAKQTFTQFDGMVDSQLQGTITQLEGVKTSQLTAATEQGKTQQQILDELHKAAVSGLTQTHNESTESIRNSIQTVIDEVTRMENPEPGKVQMILSGAEKNITKSVSDLTTSFQKGISDSAKGYDTHGTKAKEAFEQVEKGAKEAFGKVVEDCRTTIGETRKQAKEAFDGILKTHKESADKSSKQYVDEIKGLKSDVEKGFEAVKKNIKGEVQKSVKGLTGEFGTQLNGIHSEITSKAQEAYDAVKPRWKGWVKFIIQVVIAIVVTVAIGLLAASGVGLLAGLGLAFLIGAAGAVLETGLIDLLVEGKFSGFGTYAKNAFLGGIGGMFTFLGAKGGGAAGKYLEGVMGKLGGSLISSQAMSKIGSYIGEVGVGFAMDMVGTFAKEVSGQLYDNVGSLIRGEGWKGIDWGKAAGNTFTLQNVAVNFLGNFGGKVFGDFLQARGVGGAGGSVVEWINSKLPRWAMSAEHIAKIDAGGGGGVDVGGGNGHVEGGNGHVEGGNGHVEGGNGNGHIEEPTLKTEEPEIKTTEEPEIKTTEEPEVKTTEEPEVKTTEEPEVKTTEEPEVKTTEEPEVKTTEEPEVKTEEPSGKEGQGGDTDLEGPQSTGGKKSGAELAADLKYPPAPEGYHWANHQGKGVPVLRRNPSSGGSNLLQVRYEGGKFVDAKTGQIFNNVAELNAANAFHTAPKGPVQIPTSPEFNAFKTSADFKGDDQMAAQAFELFQQGKWTELETFIHQNGLNSNWPPNQGFVSITPETLPVGMKIDRYGYPGGKFVSPEGVPYTARALPVGTDGKPYNVYEVIKPINVEGGPAIPWFGETGMGTQFKLPMSVTDLINGGFLRLVTP